MVHNILNLASYLTGRFADINLAESKKQRHSMKKGDSHDLAKIHG